MPIKKTSTRREDRQRIKLMAQQGYAPEQISNGVSVKLETVEYILSGKFDEEEAAAKAEQKRRDEEFAGAAQRKEEEAAARIAAAAAAAATAASQGGQQPASGAGETKEGGGDPGAVNVTPQASSLAQEHGIDLATVEGTGTDGQITKGDVQAAIDASKGGGD